MPTVSVQSLWLNDAEFAGYFVAQDRKYDAQFGVHQKWIPGGPATDPQAVVAAGRADVGISGGSDFLMLFRATGAPVVAIGAMYQKSPAGLMSLPAKPIRTPKDLIGKRIGLQQGARPAFDAILAYSGISPNQMTFVTVGFDPSPLTSGQVDAYWAYATNQPTILASQGVKSLFMYASDFGYDFYSDVIFVTEDTLAKHEDALVAWLKASIKGWQVAIADPVVSGKTVMKYAAPGLKLQNQVTQSRVQAPLMTSELTRKKGLFHMDLTYWQRGMEVLLRTKRLSKPLDVSKMATNRLLNKALGGKNRI
jgi:ABC-type nitrate/sulfonate/bicarbonate transport system substrate-binding protein